MSYMPPLTCVHCKSTLGNKIEAWELLRPADDHTDINANGQTSQQIFEAINVNRFCCRKTLLSYNSMITQHNMYPLANIHNR